MYFIFIGYIIFISRNKWFPRLSKSYMQFIPDKREYYRRGKLLETLRNSQKNLQINDSAFFENLNNRM